MGEREPLSGWSLVFGSLARTFRWLTFSALGRAEKQVVFALGEIGFSRQNQRKLETVLKFH